ncbi:MAG: hypothetical protein COA32_10300 [Fluviicola sp.]|nr:MAG: hypothetical protein COA32_10300 [Fluviicola sp.]
MIKTLSISVFTIIFALSSYAQDIITADSISMGPKSIFMDVCLTNMNSSDFLNSMEDYSSLDLCNCMADELLPTFTKAQINYYFTQGHMSEMFEDEKSRKILTDCINRSLKLVPPPEDATEIDK